MNHSFLAIKGKYFYKCQNCEVLTNVYPELWRSVDFGECKGGNAAPSSEQSGLSAGKSSVQPAGSNPHRVRPGWFESIARLFT